MPAQTRTRPSAPGRYDLAGAVSPPNGLADLPRTRGNINARTAVGAVQDPFDGRVRTVARIRIALLDDELAHKRIEQSHWQFGRDLEDAYERAVRLGGGSNWEGGSKTSPQEAQSRTVDRICEAHENLREMEALALEAVGRSGLGFLSRILKEGFSFQRLALIGQMKGGRADVARIADRFRWLLKQCADHRAQCGPERTRMRSWRS